MAQKEGSCARMTLELQKQKRDKEKPSNSMEKFTNVGNLSV